MPSSCPPRPSVYCTRYPGNPMGRMQIRGSSEAGPCVPSQFILMMTNTFVHGEGRWELQRALNHRPSDIAPLLCHSCSHVHIFLSFFQLGLSLMFCSFHLASIYAPVSPFHPSSRSASPAKLARSRSGGGLRGVSVI